MSNLLEPWLRGPIPGLHSLIAPVLYSFQQAREDLAQYMEGLSPEQLWARPHGFGSVAFHVRHIGGSTERLLTYLDGRELTPEQMAALEAEQAPGCLVGAELLAELEGKLGSAERVVRSIDPSTLAEPRWVGRKRLPTTVAGLLVHVAEHTQRHVGQAISAAKLAAALLK